MKILIATDGSEYSRRALDECCRLFGSAGNPEIRIIAVYENIYPMMGEPLALSGEFYQKFEEEARAQAERFVAEAAQAAREKLEGGEITTAVLCGVPEREIIEEAKRFQPDLIAVGSHGRGFWGRLTLGSVSDAVVHHAPCSVFVSRSKKD
jgi:nucleotide-binding universal stress UspA family protein